MALFRRANFLALLLALPVTLDLAREAWAVPTVWSSPASTFAKSGDDTTDPTDPLNQDRLTNNVWLTRAGFEGMFNIAPGHEDAYFRLQVPAEAARGSGDEVLDFSALLEHGKRAEY